jgi:hypothetical protein
MTSATKWIFSLTMIPFASVGIASATLAAM